MSKEPTPPSRGTDHVDDQPEEIEKQIERVLQGKVQRRDLTAVAAQITEIVVSEHFSGPMPHPRHLRQYEDVLPGAAERILTMAEKSLEHNTSMSARMLAAEIDDSRRGMRFGALLFALLIICAFASMFVTESEIVPGLFLGAAAIGAITAFIKGRNGG